MVKKYIVGKSMKTLSLWVLTFFLKTYGSSEHAPEVAILILSFTSNTLLRLSGRFETTPIFVTEKWKNQEKVVFFSKKKVGKQGPFFLSLEGVCLNY